MKIKIWCDGSCKNANPKKPHVMDSVGGFGVVIEFIDASNQIHVKEIAEGPFYQTTSGRMEIEAVIQALETITIPHRKRHQIKIYSDSQYVVNTIEKGWFQTWIDQNRDKKNMDQWRRFEQIYNKHGRRNYVKVNWVKGHATEKNNITADKLANEGRKKTVTLTS